ncbi:hypothetical protein F5888DRAFT_671906 [Russula emetica]|nr:hypothetical protein F5888DRAFT_671906 [Russula emetica]
MKAPILLQRHFLLLLKMRTEIWIKLGHIPMPSCWTSSVPKLPVPELQIDEPHSHRPRNARRSINDPTEVDPEVPPPVSIPLAVLPPFFITPTQVPQNMPAFAPMVVPGTAPAAPCCTRNRGYRCRRGHPFPDRQYSSRGPSSPSSIPTSRRASSYGYGSVVLTPTATTWSICPWTGAAICSARNSSTDAAAIYSARTSSTYATAIYSGSVILPPILNDMMAMVRENRFMHLAALEQQRELMRYMNSLNEWLGNDVEDRQAELRGVSARIDQLREDVNSLGLTGLTRAFLPPPGSSLEPGGFIVPGGPGAPDAPGAPCSPGASIISVCPTSIFSRARRLFSSGTVLLGDLSVPQLSQISTPQPIQRYPI